ncbi:hypothetical protein [Verrucosispora sp. TAA-831]|uniref:hypothetical protein n=1 Tax=Verrucosispora sp. TAA-831 TaxID=3422227 RepID=UPI003D6ED4B8
MDPVILPELPTYQFTPSIPGALSLFLTVGLPILAALVMRQSWSGPRKGLVLLALAASKSFVEAWLLAALADVRFDFANTAYATGVTFFIAVMMYVGLLKGTPLQRAAIRGGLLKDPPPVR